MEPQRTRRVLRVCWNTGHPKPGEVLVAKNGRDAFLIHAVRALHHAPASRKPRLALTTSAITIDQRPKGAALHAWLNTEPPSPPLPLATAPPAAKPKPRQPSVDDRAAAMRARRLASDAAPPAKADEARWDDPEDKVNTRSPKQVRGYRRADGIATLAKKCPDVTRDHVEAARMFRVDWDIAQLGLSGSNAYAERMGVVAAGPTLGPSAAATRRSAKEREVRKVLSVIGLGAAPLLLWVVVQGRDVNAWCADQAMRHAGRKPDRKKVLGGLLATLTRLAEIYGVDERRERLREARRFLDRR